MKDDRPEIVVLCGSTRFKDTFIEVGRSESFAGRIVLSVSNLDPNICITDDLKAHLDRLHRRKIDMADRVLVLNVGGYVGESTQAEIEYAARAGKAISYLE